MKKREKLSSLTENFDKELYYDREELINRYSYEEGYKTASKNRNIEIATSMLKKHISEPDILEITGLTQEELDLLK